MIRSWLKHILALAILGWAVQTTAFAQAGSGPFFLHHSNQRASLPIAIYEGVRVEDFRKLLVAAFEESNFSLVEVTERKDASTLFKFAYPTGWTKGVARIILLVGVDENSDRKNLCMRCFLRDPELIDTAPLKEAGWMAQYELNRRIFPDMDRAFARIESSGKRYMDEKFGFNYKKQWRGEKNLYGNSFVGIRLPDLKALVVQSYRDAGFYFAGDDPEGGIRKSSLLNFRFPLDPEGNAGAVYTVEIPSQFDADGFCYPCELVEFYDPHQSLPAGGLTGMANRLTLESRFTASRVLAYEKLKASTEKYLRPGSTFSVPPQRAPLGSPRPPILPPVVT